MSGRKKVVRPAAAAVPIRRNPDAANAEVVRDLASKPRNTALHAQKATIVKAKLIAGSQ